MGVAECLRRVTCCGPLPSSWAIGTPLCTGYPTSMGRPGVCQGVGMLQPQCALRLEAPKGGLRGAVSEARMPQNEQCTLPRRAERGCAGSLECSALRLAALRMALKRELKEGAAVAPKGACTVYPTWAGRTRVCQGAGVKRTERGAEGAAVAPKGARGEDCPGVDPSG